MMFFDQNNKIYAAESVEPAFTEDGVPIFGVIHQLRSVNAKTLLGITYDTYRKIINVLPKQVDSLSVEYRALRFNAMEKNLTVSPTFSKDGRLFVVYDDDLFILSDFFIHGSDLSPIISGAVSSMENKRVTTPTIEQMHALIDHVGGRSLNLKPLTKCFEFSHGEKPKGKDWVPINKGVAWMRETKVK